MGARIEADPVHRVWLRSDPPRHQSAQPLRRSEIVRKRVAAWLKRTAGRIRADAVRPRGDFLLERPCQQPGERGLRGPDDRHGARSSLGVGRPALACFSGPGRSLVRRSELRARALAERPYVRSFPRLHHRGNLRRGRGALRCDRRARLCARLCPFLGRLGEGGPAAAAHGARRRRRRTGRASGVHPEGCKG